MWARPNLLVLVVVGSSAGAPGMALAQDAPTASPELSTSDEEARVLFTHGRAAMAEGRFEQALSLFERSYGLSGRPALLFNIGMVHDRLRQDQEAVAAFRRYLAEAPDAENRVEVERRIEVLERAIQGREADAANWAALALVIGGGAVVGGIAMVAIAAADVATVEGAPDGSAWSSVAGAYDRSEPLSIAGAIALGVGAVAAGFGVVLLVTGGDGERGTRVSFGPASVSVGGTF